MISIVDVWRSSSRCSSQPSFLSLGYFLTQQHVERREVIGAAVVVFGLALFAVFGDPAGGRENASGYQWAIHDRRPEPPVRGAPTWVAASSLGPDSARARNS